MESFQRGRGEQHDDDKHRTFETESKVSCRSHSCMDCSFCQDASFNFELIARVHLLLHVTMFVTLCRLQGVGGFTKALNKLNFIINPRYACTIHQRL